MKLVSTRNANESVEFSQAILAPSASKGGLYSPLSLPKFDGYKFKDLSYKDFALKLIQSFEFKLDKLFERALKSYEKFDEKSCEKHLKFSGKSCPIRLFKVNDKLYINELYHGPTRAFKDMALQPFASLVSELAKDKNMLIICATSGDTGPATLKAFESTLNSRVVCLYPAFGTSSFQALQMTSLRAKNLKSLAIKGDFDAAQRALKDLLADEDFKKSLNLAKIELTAANSVNFGRILFQIIYHYYALVQIDKEADIIVPSGNFGDALGAYYAKKMGAKIRRIKIASNSNNILTDFFTKGEYDLRNRVLQKTISPAMDILISSNVERLIFDKFGDKRTKELYEKLKNESFFKLTKDELNELKKDFEAEFCTDRECKKFIKDFSKIALIDPHTATCFKFKNDKTSIITSTAEWVKFVPSMFEALFDKPCVDEKNAMLEITRAYNYDLKSELLALFDEGQVEGKIYEVAELKNTILQWIKGDRK